MTTGPREVAGLWRRLAAMFYDSMLLIALYMLTAALFLPFTHGQAVTPQDSAVLSYLLRALLIAVTALYFGISWTRTGQTLGMLAWRVRVIRDDGALLKPKQVLLRLAAALLSWLPAGLGFLWILVDRERRAWHDRLTHTLVVTAASPRP